jgi:hypothetical protein
LGNREQNLQFRAAVREIERVLGRTLTLDEIDRLHREVSGNNFSLQEIIGIGIAMFG